MAIATLVVRFAADIADLEKNIAGVERTLLRTGRNLENIGSRMTQGITLPIAAAVGVAAKAAIDFESSFAGVRKTVEATEEQFKQLSGEFRNLAKTMPLSVNEINKVAEAAGQLGVSRERIVGFTETMVKLGATTNLTAEEAATAMARFANAMGQPEIDVNKLSAALVELGNKGASTEKDILDMAGRMAGAGAQIGLSAGEIFGMANALSSVGIEAEKGGSAISRLFNDLNAAVSAGGRDLENFAKVADLSSEAFRKLFKDDAASAISAFIEGLNAQKVAGADLLKILNELDITELRYRDTVLLAANAGSQFAESIRIGTRAFEEGEAANKEYQERVKTTASQLIILKNNLNDVAIIFGNALLPVLNQAVQASKPVVQALAEMATEFGKLPAGVQNVAFALIGLVAAVGPVTFAIGKITTAWSSVLGLIRVLIPDLAAAGTAFTRFAGPVAIASAALFAIKETWDAFSRSTAEGMRVLVSALPGFNGLLTAAEALGNQFPRLRGVMEDVATILKNSVIIAFESLKDAVRIIQDQFSRTADVIQRVFTPVLENLGIKADNLSRVFRNVVIPAVVAVSTAFIQSLPGVRGLLELIAVLPGFSDVERALDRIAKSTTEMAGSMRGATSDVKGMGGAIINSGASLSDFRDKALSLIFAKPAIEDGVVKPIKLAGEESEKAAEKMRKFWASLSPGFTQGIPSAPGFQLPAPQAPVDLSQFARDFQIGLNSLPGFTMPAPTFEPPEPGFLNRFVAGLANELGRALQGAKSVLDVVKNFARNVATDFISTMLSFIPGVGSALAQLAAPLVQGATKLFESLFGNRGRDLVKDFAASFGGFDALHKRLLEMGAAGEALWIKLTQGVGRNNPEQAKAVIAEVQAALNEFGTEADRAAKRMEGIGQAIEGVNAKAALFAAPFQALLAEREKLGDDPLGVDNINAKLAEMGQRGQAEFERIGVFAAAAFAGLVKETGDALVAIERLAPTFRILQQGIDEFGLTSTGTINALLDMFKLVNDEVTGPLLKNIQATGQIFAGLQQGGLLTADLFQTVASDIGASFREIEAKGGDVAKAMALSQPVLQRLWEAQQIYGNVTDETTAKLLKQAEEQGLVGAHMKDVNQKILDVLIAIADVFGAKIPEGMRQTRNAATETASHVQGELSRIKIPPIHVPVKFDIENPDAYINAINFNDDRSARPVELAAGGIVRRRTLAFVGESGPEAVIPLSQLSNVAPAAAETTVIFEDAGYAFATVSVPHIPGIIRKQLRPR